LASGIDHTACLVTPTCQIASESQVLAGSRVEQRNCSYRTLLKTLVFPNEATALRTKNSILVRRKKINYYFLFLIVLYLVGTSYSKKSKKSFSLVLPFFFLCHDEK
jgi:uncharacterized membrane protein